MGRKSKKKRELSNGAKKATPFPPVVMASNTECDSVLKNKTIKKSSFFFPPKIKASNNAHIMANKIE